MRVDLSEECLAGTELHFQFGKKILRKKSLSENRTLWMKSEIRSKKFVKQKVHECLN